MRFCILVTGKLGLRLGEIAHFSEDWINRRKKPVEVPRHDHFNKGKEGERWRPKIREGARTIPFDFDIRTEICFEKFFQKYKRFS